MQASPDTIAFVKMDGAGNDFVIIDNRSGAYRFSEAEITHMADRHQGIGCDQLVLLETSEVASVFMRLYNADGGEVGACGNATRCVAWLVMEETGETTASIETVSGMLYCERAGEMAVTVNMGEPGLDWRQIPLKEEANTADMRLQVLPLEGGVAVNMGNPHIVFFVDSIADIPLGEVGPKLEHDPIFPERTNVEVVEIHSPTKLAMRVWERGVGETEACGTGACAVAVAAVLKGKSEPEMTVILPGGDLQIAWGGKGEPVYMTGAVSLNFKGEWVRS